ncbi:MAG: hypothetical protein HOP29_13510 [Phycisphaerales bacterium]|nr:hypothetical protein [Phycisphaerales bacterium]
MRNTRYSDDEIVLCTYAALSNADDFGGVEAIHSLGRRSRGSIVLKIRNIAAMLDERKIPRENLVSPLSGRPPGQNGRSTDWDRVTQLVELSSAELLAKCKRIFDQAS